MNERGNLGIPGRDEPSITPREVQVVRAGRRWKGAWELDGARLTLTSAWGSRSALVGPDRSSDTLSATARTLLEEILVARGVGTDG